tara:strand:- start:3173 stop:3883 length:711 start_codon:yes stop_codon:yes gene_type:complete
MNHKTSKLYLVRHGQASFGEKNYDNLSPKGIKQSISLGKRLKKENFDFKNIVIGPLKRHRQTYDGIKKGFKGAINEPIVIDEFAENQLMEIAQHYIPKMLDTNKSMKEIFSEVPVWKRRKAFFKYFNIIARKWIMGEYDFSKNKFETYKDFRKRIKVAKNKVYDLMNENESTMVVSSGGAITGIYSECEPLTVDEVMQNSFEIKNASVSTFIKLNQGFTLESFNRSFIPKYLETYI